MAKRGISSDMISMISMGLIVVFLLIAIVALYYMNGKNLLEIKELAIKFYDLISEPEIRLKKIGQLLHQNWLSKKALSNKVSNNLIDSY